MSNFPAASRSVLREVALMRSLFFCLSLIVLLAACGRETELDRYVRGFEKALEWVETADAARLFEADNSSGNFRFLSVCGMTWIVGFRLASAGSR